MKKSFNQVAASWLVLIFWSASLCFAANTGQQSPPIKLGTFTLLNNETIQLQQTGQPGVRLVETTRNGGIRLFQVGPGEAFITATDPDGSVGIAFCK